MRLVVSSAKGANGAGYGAILAFDFVGNPLGTFCDGRRFGPDGDLYCVSRDEVVSFDFETGDFSGVIVNCSDLFGHSNSSADGQPRPPCAKRRPSGHSSGAICCVSLG
jgi:hypothetical protein